MIPEIWRHANVELVPMVLRALLNIEAKTINPPYASHIIRVSSALRLIWQVATSFSNLNLPRGVANMALANLCRACQGGIAAMDWGRWRALFRQSSSSPLPPSSPSPLCPARSVLLSSLFSSISLFAAWNTRGWLREVVLGWLAQSCG
ncbi:hypothetical protein BB8028_0006g05420 [Beauveria bassiana]|uniref:Uncharacterized protein n=1 Tax=Beauveria bassiana TaxID=176275 RepID=A0A2S7YJ74_BEABA|nr:hypothetical protein BB8028_0006g05420 [Beauveria bassiana]